MSDVLRDGLSFGECPRWHDDRLWYSDFFDAAVHAVTLDGRDERVFEVDGEPAGLGWMPDGTLLVAERIPRRVLRWDGTALSEHASLLPHATFHANDMVVDARGRAYVGNFGFDLDGFVEEHGLEGLTADPGPPTTVLCMVDVDGATEVVADDLAFPNGMVISPDGRTLIVAETLALRLTAFDIDDDGRLSNRRIWADLSAQMVVPDRICLDAEGAVWVANPFAPACIRVAEGGVVLDQVDVSQPAFACALGGHEGRDLFVMTAPDSNAAGRRARAEGRIETARVDVPAGTRP